VYTEQSICKVAEFVVMNSNYAAIPSRARFSSDS